MFYCKLQDRRARRLAESAIRDVIGKINYLLLESDEEGKRKVKEEVEKCAKDAKKVEEFVQNNKEKVEATLEKIDEEHKPLYKRAWDFLCYAVKKGVSFIFDHIFDILKLIAILTIGFFCFPLLKKLWNWIEDALKKGEERKKELEVAKGNIEFQKQQEKEAVPTCIRFLDDPDTINDNLPEEWEKRQDFSIQFVKDLPDDVKEKIKAWIMVNDLKGRKLNVLGGAAGDWVGGLDNALSPLEHGARTLKDSPTGRKTHRAQMDAQERQINWDVLPGGRSILVMSAIPSRKRNDGSLDTRRWNWLMKQVDAWDKAGRPSVVVKQTGSRRVQIDRDLDPGVLTNNDGVEKSQTNPVQKNTQTAQQYLGVGNGAMFTPF